VSVRTAKENEFSSARKTLRHESKFSVAYFLGAIYIFQNKINEGRSRFLLLLPSIPFNTPAASKSIRQSSYVVSREEGGNDKVGVGEMERCLGV